MTEHTSFRDNGPISPGDLSRKDNLQFLLTIFDSTPNAISISDLEGNLRIVNARALQLFGHSDDTDVIGKSIFEWITPEDTTRALETFEHLRSGGTASGLLMHLRRRDGSSFTGEVRSSIIRTDSGDPLYLLFSIEDRTAQLQYEHALQAIMKETSSSVGGQFFQSFIRELSSVLDMRCALIGRALDGTPQRITTVALCIDGEIRDPITFALEGTPFMTDSEEGIVFFPQGAAQQFPGAGFLQEWHTEAFLGVLLRSPAGQFKGVLAVAHDRPVHDTTIARAITAIFAARAAAEIGRLEADEGAWENELRMRSIIDHAPFGAHLYELTGDGRLVFAGHNRSADRILNVDHHHLVGKTIEEAWPPLAATTIPEAYKRVARGDGSYGENDLQYESGDVHGTFEINAFQTGPNRMAVFFRDVTERKEAETALLSAKEKAETADRAKSALLRNLSHEFRTPITGILGMAEIVSQAVKDHDAREAIGGIIESARRLHHSLDAILKLSQLASGAITPNILDVSGRTSIHRVLPPFRQLAEAKGLAMHTLLADGPDTVACDGELLDDILRHLLDNAIKYTAQGAISIRTSRSQESDRLWYAIDVEDTGIGIAPEDQMTIFQEFKQMSEGFGRKYEGTGLGLTVARRMAELMDGTLTVKSRVGEGSTFTVRLPASTTTASTVTGIQQQQDPTRSGHAVIGMPQVLIVEDNFINKTVIAEFLKHMCNTDHARDGKTAIRMAEAKHYDAVLMDINLGPGLDGIETTKVIRQIQGYQTTPIVAVTGYTLPGDRDRLLAEGMTSYIPKPFEQKDIQETVRNILPH